MISGLTFEIPYVFRTQGFSCPTTSGQPGAPQKDPQVSSLFTFGGLPDLCHQ